MAVRTHNQQLTYYTPEQSDSYLDMIQYGTTTSAGAAGGTTLIDTSADSGGADTYNGRYWVTCLSGANKGLSKRVIDDNGSGTLTLENSGFPNQVASGVEYMLWTSPDPVVVVDSSGSATDVVDAIRDEADDYWIDYYMCPITGNRAGEIQKITDFTSSTGTFVTDAFTGALAAGDVCLLIMPIEAGNFDGGVTEEYLARAMNRVNFAKGDGRVGPRSGSLSFDLPVTASGTLAGADVIANKSVFHGLLPACGYDEVIGKTMTISDVAASTTQIDVATGDHENVALGMAIQHNGNVSWVTGKTDGGGGVDTIDTTLPLPVAPADTELLYAPRMYKKDIDANNSGVTIVHERDGYRHTFFGCQGNVEWIEGPVLMAKFTLSWQHYVVEDEPAQFNPGAAYTTAQQLRQMDKVVNFDTTQADIGGASFTLGAEVAALPTSGRYGINGISGQQVMRVHGSATFNELIETTDSLTAEQLWQVRTAKDYQVVYGSHGNCVAFRIPVGRLVQKPHPQDQDGLQAAPYVVEAQDAGVLSDPTDGTVKVPDFSVCIF